MIRCPKLCFKIYFIVTQLLNCYTIVKLCYRSIVIWYVFLQVLTGEVNDNGGQETEYAECMLGVWCRLDQASSNLALDGQPCSANPDQTNLSKSIEIFRIQGKKASKHVRIQCLFPVSMRSGSSS